MLAFLKNVVICPFIAITLCSLLATGCRNSAPSGSGINSATGEDLVQPEPQPTINSSPNAVGNTVGVK